MVCCGTTKFGADLRQKHIHRQLRTDEHAWCKYQTAKSKRASLTHVVEVQHTKEQNAKGLELLGLGIDCEEVVVVILIDCD